MKIHICKIYVIIAVSLLPTLAFGSNNNLIATEDKIKNIDEIVTALQQVNSIKVYYPKVIPNDPEIPELFASDGTPATKGNTAYIINIDATAICQGQHYCNVGSIRAEYNTNPDIYRDPNNTNSTKSCVLASGGSCYFTPGHAMADYWPPMLQWRDTRNNTNVLYTITWNVDAKYKDVENMFVAMANGEINKPTG